jgi:hypothetical protein
LTIGYVLALRQDRVEYAGAFSDPKGGHMKTSASGAKLGRAGATALLAVAAAFSLSATPAFAATPAISSAARPSTSQAVPPGRTWASFAYDAARYQLVLFGGNNQNAVSGDNQDTVYGDTWTWKHGTWTEQQPARSPSARTGAAMVYDPATRQLLLFGGSTNQGTEGGYQGDTWVWTGRTWRQLHPATSPSARHNADMIYDAATQDVILFGGYDGHYLGDTWSWNGTTWTQLSPASSPGPRDSESLVYDAATQTAIMYGGFSSSTGRLSDTWSWDGTTWTQLYPTASPGVVTTAWQGAYDAATGQPLLFGGDPGNNNPPQNLTWAWTGTTWTQLSPAVSPPGLEYASMTYDAANQRVMLFGGASNGTQTKHPSSTWAWNGTTWIRRSQASTPSIATGRALIETVKPAGRQWPSFGYDPARNETVLFGGNNAGTVFGDTWIRRGARWTQLTPAHSPAPRTGAALCYDPASRQLLLFGGSSGIGTAGGFFGDTWIWTGTDWRQLHPATSPPARHNADLAYDAATQQVILFGGYNGHYLHDTWAWNGTTWTQQHPATSPGPVTYAWQAAFDAATGDVLLFGGAHYAHYNGRATWSWNGTDWTKLQPSTTPPGAGSGSMTYDTATHQILLFGGEGYHQDTYLNTTWAWTGTTWLRAG